MALFSLLGLPTAVRPMMVDKVNDQVQCWYKLVNVCTG